MSNTRIKIFSFNSAKKTTLQIETEVNEFLSRPEIIADPDDVEFIPDEFTTINIRYTLRKNKNKSIKGNSKDKNTK